MSRSPCLQMSSMEQRGFSSKSYSLGLAIFHTRLHDDGTMNSRVFARDANRDVDLLLGQGLSMSRSPCQELAPMEPQEFGA